MPPADAGLTRRRFLVSAGAVAGVALAGRLDALGETGSSRGSVTQRIDEIQMYVTHYSLFEEPDEDIPAVKYLDILGKVDRSLELKSPVGVQRFRQAGRDPSRLVETSASFKAMPYRISPPGISEAPPPPELISGLQSYLGLDSPDQVRAHLQTIPIAIGEFILPRRPASVTATLDGRNFEVKKEFRWRVRIRVAYVYDDGTRSLGILTPFITNDQAARFLGIPAGSRPFDPLTYEWSAPMTLGTQHRYVRPTATEPPPSAKAFEPGMTEIDFRGSRVTAAGRYTIVGSIGRPRFIQSPTSSVPEILNVLFGSVVLPDVELAYSESGVLVRH